MCVCVCAHVIFASEGLFCANMCVCGEVVAVPCARVQFCVFANILCARARSASRQRVGGYCIDTRATDTAARVRCTHWERLVIL